MTTATNEILTHDQVFAPLVDFTLCYRVRNSECCPVHPDSVTIRSRTDNLILDNFESERLEWLRKAVELGPGATVTPKVIEGLCGRCNASFSLTAAHVEVFAGGRAYARVFELGRCNPLDVVFESNVTQGLVIDATHRLFLMHLLRFLKSAEYIQGPTAPVRLAAGSPRWANLDRDILIDMKELARRKATAMMGDSI